MAHVLERFYVYVSKVTCGRCAMKIMKKNSKKETICTPRLSFAIGLVWSAFRAIPWGILSLRLLECMDFVALCFHFESCSVKVCLNWRRKVNWTFWYQIWVDRGWLCLWKKLPPKTRSACMPVQTIVLHLTVDTTLHYTTLHYTTLQAASPSQGAL